MAKAPTFEAYKPELAKEWQTIRIKNSFREPARKVAAKLIGNRARYKEIEERTGVPWFFIALLHQRESNANFATYLGNGQSLARVTTIVPKGRGPFTGKDAFVRGAIDALTMLGFTSIHDWSVERMLYLIVKWNGFGYFFKHRPNPYLWSGSYHYDDPQGVDGEVNPAGKYVRDGVYDPNAVDHQIGAAVLLRTMCDMSSEIAQALGASKAPPAVPLPKARPVEADTDDALPAAKEQPQVHVDEEEPTSAYITKPDADFIHMKEMLKSMNYMPGSLDDKWGGMTTEAFAGFINDRNLGIPAPTSLEMFTPIRELMHGELERAKAEDFVRPVSKERANADTAKVEEIAPAAKPINQSYWATKWAAITGAFATMVTTFKGYVSDAWDFFFSNKDSLPDTDSGIWHTAVSWLQSIPVPVYIALFTAGAVVLAVRLLKASRQIEQDVKTGVRK
jgi:lysozyme family protein